MKRVLVTGASGFVGAALTRRLVADGHDVHVLVRSGHATWRLRGLEGVVQLHVADLSDAAAVRSAVAAAAPAWIFHLAAHGAYPWQRDVRTMVETNVVGTVNLLEAGLDGGAESFVNAGSSSEYGYQDHAPGESALPVPNSDYAVTKLSATLFCSLAARTRQAAVTTLRLYSVYGPWEEPARLVPTLLVRGLRGRLPALASPESARDFVHVDDVCGAFLAAAARSVPGEDAVYNVGTGRQTTIRQIVDLVRQRLGIAAEPAWGSMPDRAWDTSVWVADPRRIRRVLGWTAGISLEEGLGRFLSWFRDHPELLALYEESLDRA